MFRSATFKLTAWYLGLVMAISLIFSGVVYRLASGKIASGINLQSQRIYNQFPVFDHDPSIMRPDRDIASDEHTLLLQLVLFNIIVLILAGLASYLLAKRTLRPIEEAHEQQKRFTADVSHELRTPLTALKMESEVALMSPNATQNELRKTIESNLEEVSKLESLINNILRLTRLEADELRQSFVKVNVKTAAEEAVGQIEKQAEGRKIEIKKELISNNVIGDKASIIQLLIILLDNAIKYSPSGTTITLKTYAKDGGIVFSVEDQGIGINKQALEHIFDRFYRASTSRTNYQESEGQGLGLSIAKMIADVHQAVITVTSQINKGTTVNIFFPNIEN